MIGDWRVDLSINETKPTPKRESFVSSKFEVQGVSKKRYFLDFILVSVPEVGFNFWNQNFKPVSSSHSNNTCFSEKAEPTQLCPVFPFIDNSYYSK